MDYRYANWAEALIIILATLCGYIAATTWSF